MTKILMQIVFWKIKQCKATVKTFFSSIINNVYSFFYLDYNAAYSVPEGDIEGGM